MEYDFQKYIYQIVIASDDRHDTAIADIQRSGYSIVRTSRYLPNLNEIVVRIEHDKYKAIQTTYR